MDNQLNPPTFELQPEVKRMILGHVERGNLSEALGLLSPGQLEMVRNEITSDTRKKLALTMNIPSTEDTVQRLRYGQGAEDLDTLVLIAQKADRTTKWKSYGIVTAQDEEQEPPIKPDVEPKDIPPYQRSFLRESVILPMSPIVQEIQADENGHFATWLRAFEDKFQVSSHRDVSYFAKRSLLLHARKAHSSLKYDINLTSKESDALYHPDQSLVDYCAAFSRAQERKEFGHLCEYVTILLLDQLKADIGIDVVFKTSPEEDFFRGVDFVVHHKDRGWIGIDLTTMVDKEKLALKINRATDTSIQLRLANVQRHLQDLGLVPSRGRINFSRILMIDNGVLKKLTYKYLSEIMNGGNPHILEMLWKAAGSQQEVGIFIEEIRKMLKQA